MKRPRRPRWPASINTLGRAYTRAARLTRAEVAQIMATVRPAATHVLAGAGTHADWLALAGACTLAQAIEAQGIVRGLHEHLAATEAALDAVLARAWPDHDAPTPGPWRPAALRYDERDAIDCFVSDILPFQLGALSAGELAEATRRAEVRIRAEGGVVVRHDIGAPASAPAANPSAHFA